VIQVESSDPCSLVTQVELSDALRSLHAVETTTTTTTTTTTQRCQHH
jgi:hypothetical protein